MTSSHVSSRWLTSFRTALAPGDFLVCLPHAGGSASVFRSWQDHSDWLNVIGVQLPGREWRIGESAHSTMEGLLGEFVPELVASLAGRDYALYGHSMGALVAFEAARTMRDEGLPLPRRLYVAGCAAPHTLHPDPVYDLPRDELLRWLTEVNGMDPEVLRYPQLIELMLHTVRCDLKVYDTYVYRRSSPLDIPIGVFYGDSDPELTVTNAPEWRKLAAAEFRVEAFSGGHFFVQEHAPRIVSRIEKDLRRSRKGSSL
ncbi:alpha/beta fold hydrolase [Streptomyces sp. NPDC048312]|uniref:Thioesterase n=1 Tax=Streptomyces melanovinaceus TaxID=1182637 RepID=A0A0A6ZAK7_9ACTN|nr:thioesterase [Streptomyces melanovinaceus]